MTDKGRKEPGSASEMVLSPRARVCRYREQPARFTRLAEGDEDATFSDRWTNLARECASLARKFEETDEPPGAKGERLPKDVTRRRSTRELASSSRKVY